MAIREKEWPHFFGNGRDGILKIVAASEDQR